MMLATEPIGLRAVAKSALARVVRNTQPRVASRRLSSTPGAVNLRQTQYPQIAESYKVPRVRIDLQPYRCRCGQSSTWVKAGVVEHAHYVSVEPHGVEVTFNPDLVIVPLTNRARSLLGQRFLIGSVVFAIDGSRAVNVRAVWCPQLVDLHLEVEIVGHEGRVVVALRLRTGKADLDPRVRVLREPHPLQAQHEVGRGGLCAPKNTHVGSCYRFQGPVDHFASIPGCRDPVDCGWLSSSKATCRIRSRIGHGDKHPPHAEFVGLLRSRVQHDPVSGVLRLHLTDTSDGDQDVRIVGVSMRLVCVDVRIFLNNSASKLAPRAPSPDAVICR